MVNHPDPPSIEELHQVFLRDGVPLAVRASRKAIKEAKIDLHQIVSFGRPGISDPRVHKFTYLHG